MRVLVECYPDAALLRALGVPARQLRHERCKGEVVKKVRKLGQAIGVVDQDPLSAQPRDLGNYEQVQAEHGLRLLARRSSHSQRIIVICPRLEDWLIERARKCGVDPTHHDLPRDPDKLHSVPRYEKKGGFHRFLAALVDRDEGLTLLGRWVLRGADPAGR